MSMVVEPTCERQRAGRVETEAWMSGDLWSSLLFGCRMVSTQLFAGAHVLVQPALFFLKLVEPGCDEGAARVDETTVRMSGELWSPAKPLGEESLSVGLTRRGGDRKVVLRSLSRAFLRGWTTSPAGPGWAPRE